MLLQSHLHTLQPQSRNELKYLDLIQIHLSKQLLNRYSVTALVVVLAAGQDTFVQLQKVLQHEISVTAPLPENLLTTHLKKKKKVIKMAKAKQYYTKK